MTGVQVQESEKIHDLFVCSPDPFVFSDRSIDCKAA